MQTDISVNNNVNNTKTEPKKELNPGYSGGETITLKEIVELSGKSKVTVLKIIKTNKIEAVGKVVSGKKGRPGNLYSRAQIDTFFKI